MTDTHSTDVSVGPYEHWRLAIQARQQQLRWSVHDVVIDIRARTGHHIPTETLRFFLSGRSLFPRVAARMALKAYWDSLPQGPEQP